MFIKIADHFINTDVISSVDTASKCTPPGMGEVPCTTVYFLRNGKSVMLDVVDLEARKALEYLLRTQMIVPAIEPPGITTITITS